MSRSIAGDISMMENGQIILVPKPYGKSMNEIEAIRGPIYSLGNLRSKQ